MAVTLTICERNGPSPGIVTENIRLIDYKMVDDINTPYSQYNAVINLGSNSYTKYIYIRFSGSFNTVGNVSITHLSGNLLTGSVLMSSPTITLSSDLLSYTQPSTTLATQCTTNISSLGSRIGLLVGSQGTAIDPASAPNKGSSANNIDGAIFTNYFVTQLRTNRVGSTGSMNDIVFQVSYSEV